MKGESRKMAVLDIVFFSFLIALTGAISPGPLLTYTVYKSLQSERSYLVGIFICIGHAILELVLIIIILVGFGPFISNKNVIIVIGLLGGTILVFFGLSILNDLKSSKIDFSFLTASGNETGDPVTSVHSEETTGAAEHFSRHPVIGGVLISMSNPYWWMWWAIIGLNFMTQFSVTLSNQPAFWAFFLGHELGDILWYVPVATALGFTHKFMTKKVYTGILVACSVFMIVFGLYLAITPVLSL